jgi:hypothetical protein
VARAQQLQLAASATVQVLNAQHVGAREDGVLPELGPHPRLGARFPASGAKQIAVQAQNLLL